MIATGDRRRSLEAIRDHLASELATGAAAASVAPIAKELRAVIAELASMPNGSEADSVADLTARITARRQKAQGL